VKFCQNICLLPIRAVIGFWVDLMKPIAAVRLCIKLALQMKEMDKGCYLGSFYFVLWHCGMLRQYCGFYSGELIPGMSEWGLEIAMVGRPFIGIYHPIKSADLFGLS